MIDKIICWLTYKLLYRRLITEGGIHCIGARYEQEGSRIMFDVRIRR